MVTRVDPQKRSAEDFHACSQVVRTVGMFGPAPSSIRQSLGFSFSANHSFSRVACVGSSGIPFPIGKHENIGAGQTSATRAGGQGIEGVKGFLVHFDPQVRRERPNLLSALIHALEVQEGAMAFGDRILGETGSLKMSVDVGGEDKGGQVLFADPFEQKGESAVGVGFAIKIEPVSVKAPSQSGGFPEPTGWPFLRIGSRAWPREGRLSKIPRCLENQAVPNRPPFPPPRQSEGLPLEKGLRQRIGPPIVLVRSFVK